MSLRKNLVFSGLFLCLVFQFSGCGDSGESASDNKNYNRAVNTNEKPKVESTKAKEETSQIPAVSEETIKASKIKLDALVKAIPNSGVEGSAIGPDNLNKADKFCRSRDKLQTPECRNFFNEMENLIRQVSNYCKFGAEKCEKINPEDTAIKYIVDFCKLNEVDKQAYKNYPACNAIRESENAQSSNTNTQVTDSTNANVNSATHNSGTNKTDFNGEKEAEKNSNAWSNLDLWTLLLYAAGGVAGLVLLGGIGWLTYSYFTNAFANERKATEHNFRKASRHAQELNQKIADLEKVVNLQSGQFAQMQTAIKSLQRQVSEFSGQTFKEEIFAPTVKQPEPKFPVSAEDYLGKNSAYAQPATADLIGGLLINDLNKGNEFLIVGDSELSDELFYAVPNQSRFNTKGEYLNYYQNYYAFENPSSGAILIKTPALVRRVEGGWKLVQKGELEVS